MQTLTQAQQLILVVAGVCAMCLIVILVRRMARHRRRQARPLPQPATPYLESTDGRLRFVLTSLDTGYVIGRGPGADLVIGHALPQADSVSERHARIYRDASTGHLMIEDLNSTNGTFVNGRRAPRKNLLRDRWAIGLGSVTLVYHDGESDTGPLD
jgi:pSer/pThr/pTyr-binding forkhead associated (FHA) protein